MENTEAKEQSAVQEAETEGVTASMPVESGTEENQTDLDKAKILENKTDKELAAAQVNLTNALAALPEADEGLMASARSVLEADLNLIQEELESRTNQTVDAAQTAIDGFWKTYGSKINETAKWVVLALIIYRLFFF